MTDQAKKQVQRRRKLLISKKRKKRLFLLALVLILGAGAFLFHKEKFYAVPEILTWLTENKPGEVLASTPTSSPRADIYDRNFRPLAATYETYALYARPLEITDPAAAAGQLQEILGPDQQGFLADLKSERGFVWIAKGINKDLADTINSRHIKGVYQVVETKRYYPNGETAAHAIGFVENDQGLDGIEFQYNALLRGDEISRAELETLHFRTAEKLGQTGTHLVLNLDLMLQDKIERFLAKRVKITGAASGAVLLMDANTGGIVAMASYPAFNPNHYWEFPSTALNNNVVTQPVYPSELALIFQQAAAINLKNERKTEAVDSSESGEPLLVIEPKILKRRKLSVAPRVEQVDQEYLAHFAHLLGFDQKPLTDLPLKDESPVSPTLALTEPSFHSSALRLLTGFTALVNNGKLVTPHLLHKAYPRENPVPVEPKLAANEQTALLHPATSTELVDFLAVKWLKADNRNAAFRGPMFFESHRFVSDPAEPGTLPEKDAAAAQTAKAPRITQSVMLGAIPGKDPKLTMIGLLSYPANSDEAYPDGLEAFGNKFSILSPDQDLVQKMLYVADQPPLTPSIDFWPEGGCSIAANIEPHSAAKQDFVTESKDSRKYMPDVTGKSLRAGLQTLQHFNLDIRLVGSGRIISQRPAAGSELKSGEECFLEMQQDI